MSKRIKLPAFSVAQMLVLNAKLYGDEKGKECSRYRYTKEGLRRVSGWSRLSAAFLQDVSDEMFRLGWTVIELSDTEFAAIETRKLTVWSKLSMKRVMEMATHQDAEDIIDAEYYKEFADHAESDAYDD